MPTTDHLRDYGQDLEKYEAAHFLFPSRKINIRRITILLVILFLKLKLL